MMNQLGLPMSILGTIRAGDNKFTLGTLVTLFKRELLKPAPFQRAFEWNRDRQLGWADTLREQEPLWGTFCTYQRVYHGIPEGIVYLADGYQRLMTTLRILDNPQSFGFSESELQFKEEKLDLYSVTVQHDYLDDERAFIKFQQVNYGTALHPAAYYRGHMMEFKGGVESGFALLDKINEIVSACDLQAGVKTYKADPRKYGYALQRGSYALFLQFLIDTKNVQYWEYAAGTVKRGQQVVEKELVAAINGLSSDEIDKKLKQFATYLTSLTATIDYIFQQHLRETEPPEKQIGRTFSRTSFRSFLHLGIYKRNNRLSNEWYENSVKAIIANTIEGTIDLHKFGYPKPQQIRLGRIDGITRALTMMGIELSPEKRSTSKMLLKPGYDHSHVLPFATNGNGETIPEPASRNRARGAKPIEGGQP